MSAGDNSGDIRVAVEAAGTDEAIENIDKTEEKLNEAGEEMGNTADSMQSLTRRMQGLGMALAASLAVATAGLLSQVPVLGQAMGGLKAIVQGLAFQLDQLLRSMGAGGLTSAMYDLSAAIFNLEGAAGAVVGAATGLLSILAPLAALFLKLGTTVAGFSAGVLALAAAVGAVIGVLGVLALDELGVLDWFRNLGRETRKVYDKYVPKLKGAINDVLGMLGDLAGWATDGVSGAFSWIVDAFKDPKGAAEDVYGVLTDIGGWATSKVSGAFDWLGDTLGDPLGTVEDIFETLEDIAEKTWNSVVEISMELADVDPDLNPFSSGNQDASDFVPDISYGSGGGGENKLVDVSDFAADRGGTNVSVNMDGRSLTQNDSRYRRDGTAQRNRNG